MAQKIPVSRSLMFNRNSKPILSIPGIAGAPAEPLSDEDRSRLETEYAERRLEEIYVLAIGNKDIARALCKKAISCAQVNDKLSNLIKDGLKKSHGRQKKWTTSRYRNLLLHYAGAIGHVQGDLSEARAWLIDYERRMGGTLLSEESMENRITQAIKCVDLSTLPDWVLPIIQARIDQGKKRR